MTIEINKSILSQIYKKDINNTLSFFEDVRSLSYSQNASDLKHYDFEFIILVYELDTMLILIWLVVFSLNY